MQPEAGYDHCQWWTTPAAEAIAAGPRASIACWRCADARPTMRGGSNRAALSLRERDDNLPRRRCPGSAMTAIQLLGDDAGLSEQRFLDIVATVVPRNGSGACVFLDRELASAAGASRCQGDPAPRRWVARVLRMVLSGQEGCSRWCLTLALAVERRFRCCWSRPRRRRADDRARAVEILANMAKFNGPSGCFQAADAPSRTA